jgi:hypothetical protein
VAAGSPKLFDVSLPFQTMEYLGSLPRAVRYRTTEHVNQAFLPMVIQRGLAVTHRMVRPSPEAAHRSLFKYDRLAPVYDGQCLALAYCFMVKHFAPFLQGSGVISMETAWTSMNKQSSPGFPHNINFRKKSDMSKEQIFSETTSILADRTCSVIWSNACKVELRPVEKLKEYGAPYTKLRTFTASPVHLALITNMFCLDFNNRFYACAGRTWSCVGISKYGPGFDKLYRRLKQRGKGYAYDGNAYDSSLYSIILRLVLRFRIEMCTSDLEFEEVLAWIYDQNIYSFIVDEFGNCWVKFSGGPSGGSNTVVDNTLGHFLILVHAIIYQYRSIYGSMPSYEWLMENIDVALFGDDNLYATENENFSAVELSPIFTNYGLNTTAEFEVPMDVMDLSFLSHNVIYLSDYDTWVPTLPLGKLVSSLLWGSEYQVPAWHFFRTIALRMEGFFNYEFRTMCDTLIREFLVGPHYNAKGTFELAPDVFVTMSDIMSSWHSENALIGFYLRHEGLGAPSQLELSSLKAVYLDFLVFNSITSPVPMLSKWFSPAPLDEEFAHIRVTEVDEKSDKDEYLHLPFDEVTEYLDQMQMRLFSLHTHQGNMSPPQVNLIAEMLNITAMLSARLEHNLQAKGKKKKKILLVVKRKAQPSQKKPKKQIVAIKGRGAYHTASTRLGHAAGLLGDGAAHLWSTITGRGAYTVKSNTLMSGQAPAFRNGVEGTVRLGGHCFVQDIVGSVAFSVQQLAIQVANPIIDPKLSNIARNFEEYEIHGMVFYFKSTAGSAVSSTNNALGTVILAAQYDPLDKVFVSKFEMENYQYAVSCKASENTLYPLECASVRTPIERLYVRPGAPDGDIRLYDFANMNIATVGMQAAVTIGELWCSYDISLFKPKLSIAGAMTSSSITFTNSATGVDFPVLGTSGQFPGPVQYIPAIMNGVGGPLSAMIVVLPQLPIGAQVLLSSETCGTAVAQQIFVQWNDSANIASATQTGMSGTAEHNISVVGAKGVNTGSLSSCLYTVTGAVGAYDGSITTSTGLFSLATSQQPYTNCWIALYNGVGASTGAAFVRIRAEICFPPFSV